MEKNNTKKETDKINRTMTEVSEMLRMYNHIIDFVPELSKIKEGSLGMVYGRLLETLQDMYTTNQNLLEKINEVSNYFYEENDELDAD